MGRLGIPELTIIVLFLVLYFLPSILGYKKSNANAICVLNFFLGWTLIGWVVALVWAVSKDKKEIIINNTSSVSNNVSDEIIKLGELCKSGVISRADYENQKRKLLSK